MRFAASVSLLEQFNRYLCGRSTYSKLMDYAFGEKSETENMKLGKLFHSVLEEPAQHTFIEKFDGVEHMYYGERDLLAMTQQTVDQALQHVPVLGLRELEGQRHFGLPDGNIMIVKERLDHIIGGSIIDHKSKWNKTVSEYELIKVEEQYEDSVQGLYYLYAFEADTIQYIIYWMNYTHPLAEIKHIQSVSLDRPKDLEAKLHGHVNHFYDWASNVGLLEKLSANALRTPLEIF